MERQNPNEVNVCNFSSYDSILSGRRGSNPPPEAWKATALPNELLPLIFLCKKVGADGFEPPKTYVSRFTVCPIWPLWYTPFLFSKNFQKTLLSFLESQMYAVFNSVQTFRQKKTNFFSRKIITALLNCL